MLNPIGNVTDWDLVERARNGETNAFAELVRRYQAPVVHFCYRMIGSMEDAEDLAQESFLRIHRHLQRLRPKAKFSTIVFGIARNLTLNAIRDANRRGRGRTDPMDGPRSAVLTIDHSRRPDRSAHLREIEDGISEALERLSPEHREVLLLRELQGLDYEEIGRITKVRRGTVKSRLARAREQLRAQIQQFGAYDS